MESGGRRGIRNLGPDIKSEIIEVDTTNGTVNKSVTLDGFIVAPTVMDKARNALYSSTINISTSVNPISVKTFKLCSRNKNKVILIFCVAA